MNNRQCVLSVVLLVMVLSCLVALCADVSPFAAPKIPVKDFSKATAYTVERIVDGDTVVLKIDGKNVKVRLVGVDTPGTALPTKPVERYGKEAAQFLINLLKGEKVYIKWKPDEKNDKFGRALLYLWRAPDGLFVNLEIVRQGYGHAYTRFPFKHMKLFQHYEKEAREAKRGLWELEEGKKNEVKKFASVKEIMAALPADLQPRRGKRWDNLPARMANDWIGKHVIGSTLVALTEFSSVTPTQAGNEAQVSAKGAFFRVNGVPYSVWVRAKFDINKWGRPLAKLRRERHTRSGKRTPGDAILITGTVKRMLVERRQKNLSIDIMLKDCSFKPKDR